MEILKQINRNIKALQIPSLGQHGNHSPGCSGHSFICCQARGAVSDFSRLFHGYKMTVTKDNLSIAEVSKHCHLIKQFTTPFRLIYICPSVQVFIPYCFFPDNQVLWVLPIVNNVDLFLLHSPRCYRRQHKLLCCHCFHTITI